jgi:hypothetical protein
MTTTRLRLAVAGETRFPQVLPRPEFAGADSGLARDMRAPFFLRTWGTSRFPTPLHAHRPNEVGL